MSLLKRPQQLITRSTLAILSENSTLKTTPKAESPNMSLYEPIFDYSRLRRLTLQQKREIVKRIRPNRSFKGPGSFYYPVYYLDILHNHDHALMVNQFNSMSNLHCFFQDKVQRNEFVEWLNGYYKTVDMQKKLKKRRPLVPKDQQKGKVWEIFKRTSKVIHYDGEHHYAHRLAMNAPETDFSTVTVEQLLGLSELKMAVLQEYFNDLASAPKKHPRLQDQNRLSQFQEMMVKVNCQLNTLVCIDVEAFERNTNTVTEVGICIFDPLKNGLSQSGSFHKIHILIKEALNLRNGNFVPDNKDNFLGGSSLILDRAETTRFIETIIKHYFIERKQLGMQGVLVGHSVGGDIKWLKSLKIEFPQNMHIVDSQNLFQLVNGEANSSVGAILRRLDIPHAYLHNAGNDAYFTLLMLMKLCDPQVRVDYALDDFDQDIQYGDIVNSRKANAAQPRKPKTMRKPVKVTEFVPPTSYSNHRDALYAIFGGR